jgi:hypothetical protein
MAPSRCMSRERIATNCTSFPSPPGRGVTKTSGVRRPGIHWARMSGRTNTESGWSFDSSSRVPGPRRHHIQIPCGQAPPAVRPPKGIRASRRGTACWQGLRPTERATQGARIATDRRPETRERALRHVHMLPGARPPSGTPRSSSGGGRSRQGRARPPFPSLRTASCASSSASFLERARA